MEKMIFSRKKSTFFLGDGMAGISVRKWTNYEGGASGGAVALLSGFFRDGH